MWFSPAFLSWLAFASFLYLNYFAACYLPTSFSTGLLTLNCILNFHAGIIFVPKFACSSWQFCQGWLIKEIIHWVWPIIHWVGMFSIYIIFENYVAGRLLIIVNNRTFILFSFISYSFLFPFQGFGRGGPIVQHTDFYFVLLFTLDITF